MRKICDNRKVVYPGNNAAICWSITRKEHECVEGESGRFQGVIEWSCSWLSSEILCIRALSDFLMNLVIISESHVHQVISGCWSRCVKCTLGRWAQEL